jgi:hypothetical protein
MRNEEMKKVVSVDRRMYSSTLLILSFVCMCFLGMGTTHAQVTTADMVGTVTDSTGAVVISASVTATNKSTGESKTATVSGSGEFEFSLLQVGSYKVTVQAPGFKVYTTQLTLAVGDRARINAALALGENTQTVNVEATTPALQSDTSTIGTLITSEATQDLPLNGRNLLNLVTLGAGVTGGMENGMASGFNPNDRRPASNFSVNGQSDVNNNNLIDGMDNNERFLGMVGVRPSVEAVDQVKVFTNLYTAEISRTAGGVADLITQSGTNQFHGSAYEYLRNDVLDARNYFSRTGPKPELRQNQFGTSIGGPILKNKAFFFFDYEGFRMVEGDTQTSTVPTLYEENNPGDFTDLGPTCPKIAPSQIQAIGLNYFKLYPAPNVPVAIPGSNCTPPLDNGSYTLGQSQFATTYDSKVDYRFSGKDSAYARFSYNTTSTFIPGNYPVVDGVNPGAGFAGTFAGPSLEVQLNGALGYVHIFTSHLILDLGTSYVLINNQADPLNVGKSVATDFGFPGTVNLPGQVLSSGLPSVSFTQGYGSLGDAGYIPLQILDNTYQYMGSVLWLKGAHSFKMGAALIRRQGTYEQSSAARGEIAFQNAYTGNSLGDLLTDQAAELTRAETVITPSMRSWEPSVYIQDDWRMRPNLTINLGVRYDVYTPFSTANNAITNFDPSLSLLVGPTLPAPQNSSPTADVNVDYGDVAPRVGFAYTVAPGMVLRGGYGISYYPGNETSQAQMKNAPFTYSFTCGSESGANDPCPAAYANPADGAGYLLSTGMPIPVVANVASLTTPAGYANISIDGTDFNFKNSYIQQYSLNLEKDFKGNLLTLAYVGNRGSRLVTYEEVNQYPYFGAARPFPTIPTATILETVSAGISNYNALQATFERRMKNGLAANINYTRSKDLTNAAIPSEGGGDSDCQGQCHVDNGSGQTVVENNFNQYEYGGSYLDTRDRISGSLVYDLPFGRSFNGTKAGLAKGWSLNSIYWWQTGNPFTVTNSNGNQSDIGLSSDRPNIVSTGQPGFHRSLSEWYDVSRFHLQGMYLLGDERNNTLYGPDSQALALSAVKMFPIHENIKLQFRAESFNLLNTPSFSDPGETITTYTNGIASNPPDAEISSTRPSSTPRQLQFVLRLIF